MLQQQKMIVPVVGVHLDEDGPIQCFGMVLIASPCDIENFIIISFMVTSRLRPRQFIAQPMAQLLAGVLITTSPVHTHI